MFLPRLPGFTWDQLEALFWQAQWKERAYMEVTCRWYCPTKLQQIEFKTTCRSPTQMCKPPCPRCNCQKLCGHIWSATHQVHKQHGIHQSWCTGQCKSRVSCNGRPKNLQQQLVFESPRYGVHLWAEIQIYFRQLHMPHWEQDWPCLWCLRECSPTFWKDFWLPEIYFSVCLAWEVHSRSVDIPGHPGSEQCAEMVHQKALPQLFWGRGWVPWWLPTSMSCANQSAQE